MSEPLDRPQGPAGDEPSPAAGETRV